MKRTSITQEGSALLLVLVSTAILLFFCLQSWRIGSYLFQAQWSLEQHAHKILLTQGLLYYALALYKQKKLPLLEQEETVITYRSWPPHKKTEYGAVIRARMRTNNKTAITVFLMRKKEVVCKGSCVLEPVDITDKQACFIVTNWHIGV